MTENAISKCTIIERAAYIFACRGYPESEISWTELANECAVSVERLSDSFASRHLLLIDVINHVQAICSRKLFQALKSHVSPSIEHIDYLVTSVSTLMMEYPECGCPFKIYSTPEVVLSPAYNRLRLFFDAWEKAVFRVLSNAMRSEQAKRVATVYVTLLQGSLMESPVEEFAINSNAAGNFLLTAAQHALTSYLES